MWGHGRSCYADVTEKNLLLSPNTPLILSTDNNVKCVSSIDVPYCSSFNLQMRGHNITTEKQRKAILYLSLKHHIFLSCHHATVAAVTSQAYLTCLSFAGLPCIKSLSRD